MTVRAIAPISSFESVDGISTLLSPAASLLIAPESRRSGVATIGLAWWSARVMGSRISARGLRVACRRSSTATAPGSSSFLSLGLMVLVRWVLAGRRAASSRR